MVGIKNEFSLKATYSCNSSVFATNDFILPLSITEIDLAIHGLLTSQTDRAEEEVISNFEIFPVFADAITLKGIWSPLIINERLTFNSK